jgi:hypothetical protein
MGRVYHQSIDQTPRPLRTGLHHHNFLSHQHNISPQNLLIDPISMQPLRRDPSHSPMSEYVLVEKNDAESAIFVEDHQPPQAKEKKTTFKTSRKSTSTRARPDSDPFVSEFHSARRQSNDKKARDAKRVGGRSVGMHLPTDVAARAKQLRDEGSCWICCFQRDSVSAHPQNL